MIRRGVTIRFDFILIKWYNSRMDWKDKKQLKAYRRASYVANLEKEKRVAKLWRIANSEKIKIQRKAWRKANKQKIKAYSKAYRKTHKEQRSVYNKAWFKANPEKARAQSKVWREAHPEKTKAMCKAWCDVNKEKIKAYAKVWEKANVELRRGLNRAYRARKHTTKIGFINEGVVFLRDGGICQHCKKRVSKKISWPDPLSLSIDHIIPLNKGGTHTYDNVQLAHSFCNVSKKDRVLPQGEQLRMF